ncbi:MAG TPA: nucleotide disphospho-sugar-binding domain-containing protein, partial [Anaeromyxobacteraceae bacterium]|nr:nucleotide disphospho-sugar-binding domain-containing protein [Anaeromyxobacteraceae bacterium]
IHHGGVGTMATAMRAGVPSLGIPFFGDQYFWSHRLHRVGVGPAPVPREAVSERTLAEALRVLADPAVRERAASLGRVLRAENGVARSAEAFEQMVAVNGNGGRR